MSVQWTPELHSATAPEDPARCLKTDCHRRGWRPAHKHPRGYVTRQLRV